MSSSSSSASSSHSPPDLIVERLSPSHDRGVIVKVTLNRPHAMNALSMSLVKQVTATLQHLACEPNIVEHGAVVILTGAGKAFCSGVDLSMAAQLFQNSNTIKTDDESQLDIVNIFSQFPYPIIAAINGPCYTGGLELALACDILLASEAAQFGDTHAKFGIAPSWGLSQKLQRLVGVHRALEISLSAQPLSAIEADRIGLVNRVVPASQLLPTALQLADNILANRLDLLKHYKRIVYEGGGKNLNEALKFERDEALRYYKSMTPEQFQMMNEFLQARRTKKDKVAPSKL